MKNTTKTESAKAYIYGFHITMRKKGSVTSCTCRRGKHTVYVRSTAKNPEATCTHKLEAYCKENHLSMDDAEIAKEDTTPVKQDTYDKVTDKILDSLENEKTVPWLNPVIGGKPAYNIESGKTYGLANQILLRGNAYGTMKQWNNIGGRIIKGSHADHIVTWARIETAWSKKHALTEEEKEFMYLPKYVAVFPLDCVNFPNGMPDWLEKVLNEQQKFENHPIEIAETISNDYMARTGVTEKENSGNVNYYSTGDDAIHMVDMERFRNSESYYATKFHELGHSTGHAKRLNRDLSGKKGSFAYSKEELVAEMTSAYIMNLLGIETEQTQENNASYIQSWIEVLHNDKHVFLQACAQAEKAAALIMNGKSVSEWDGMVLPF